MGGPLKFRHRCGSQSRAPSTLRAFWATRPRKVAQSKRLWSASFRACVKNLALSFILVLEKRPEFEDEDDDTIWIFTLGFLW
jgi:hypothetical protein